MRLVGGNQAVTILKIQLCRLTFALKNPMRALATFMDKSEHAGHSAGFLKAYSARIGKDTCNKLLKFAHADVTNTSRLEKKQHRVKLGS